MGSVSGLNSFTYLIISSELIQIKTPCPCYILYILLDQKAKVKGDRARPSVLLTGDESYDKGVSCGPPRLCSPPSAIPPIVSSPTSTPPDCAVWTVLDSQRNQWSMYRGCPNIVSEFFA